LTIVGDGPEKHRLEALAAELGLSNWVRFTGEVDDDRKTEILVNEADVFASASLREGFCLSALEAMAAGNPVVISHQPGLSQNGTTEYVADGVNGLITNGDIESLAGAFLRITTGPDLYREMSRNAVDTASRYTWDAAAAQLEMIYKRIGSKPKSLPQTHKDRPATNVASD
jgi:glycosyltransferase involved in cell wall biosynthesis